MGTTPPATRSTVKDPMGRVTTTVFDALNRPIVVIDPMGNATTTTYDADDEVVQTVDPMGRITTATYSVRGWVPTVTDPLDLTTTYTYNSTGQTIEHRHRTASGGGPEDTVLQLQRRRRADQRGGRAWEHHVL